ncbi:MAG: fused MFS/spermidine synthase [Acidobacteriota bacterium]
MSKRRTAHPSLRPAPAASLWPLLLCLLLSGAGSLALETVWSRRLELVFGSTTLAISTVLAAYMLGLGLGGLFGGRLASRLKNGARWYAQLEIAIGVIALLIPFLLAKLPALQASIVSLPFWGAASMRFVLALLVMIAPTMMMGATLPIVVMVARQRSPHTRDPAALIYGVNTLGAVAGTLFVTFYAFPHWGLSHANTFGAALDIAAGVIALLTFASAAQTAPSASARTAESTPMSGLGSLGSPLVLSYGLVGFISLACEVAWARTLALSFGSSVYAFATMLAAFLIGIGLGSLFERWLPQRLDPVALYGRGIGLLALTSFITFWLLQRVPDLALSFFERFGTTPAALTSATLLLSLLAMLAPTLVLGALLPLLVRARVARGADDAEALGAVYFANTIGSALGAFLTGFVLIPQFGLAQTMAWIAALAFAVSAAALLASSRVAAGVSALLAITMVLLPPSWDRYALTRGVFYRPNKYMEFGVKTLELERQPPKEILYYKDGVSATISVHREGLGLDLRVNGKPDASYGDMPTQSMLGHLPMLLTPDAKRVAVIGLASGVTTGAVLLHDPEHVDVIDIEPAIVGASHQFDEINGKPLESPKVRLILDDGRNHLAYTRDSYDVIISEPSNPVVAGCANLFTREFFQAAHGALRDGGRLMQWLQVYGMNQQTVASVLASITGEFKYVYGFSFSRGWNDLLLLGTDRELTVAELRRYEVVPLAVRQDLLRLNVLNWADVAAQLRLMPSDLKAWAAKAEQANTDDSMYVELETPWLIRRDAPDVSDAIDAAVGDVWKLTTGTGPALDPNALADLAWSNIGLRADMRQARKLLNEALDRGASPRSAAVAGLVRLIEKPDSVEAVRTLELAVQAAPDDWIVRSSQARALLKRQRYEQALPHADAAVELSHGDTRELRLRQQLRAKLGQLEPALRDAEAGVAAPYAQFDKTIWGEAGMLAAQVGRSDLAIKFLEHYLQLESQADNSWLALAAAYSKLGRSEDAALAQRNAKLATQNQVLLVHRRARRIARFESSKAAIDLLRELTKVHPEYTPAADDLRTLERRAPL